MDSEVPRVNAAPSVPREDRLHRELDELELLAEGRAGWVMPTEPSPAGRAVVERIRRRQTTQLSRPVTGKA